MRESTKRVEAVDVRANVSPLDKLSDTEWLLRWAYLRCGPGSRVYLSIRELVDKSEQNSANADD